MLIAQKKKFLINIIGAAVLILGFLAIQSPKAEAAETIGKFVRIKIDGDGGTLDKKDLWNAFLTDNGEFDDFSIPNTVTSYNADDHVCGLLLTDEDGGGADKDDIVWTKKGAILGKNTDIKDDVDDVGYKSCTNEGQCNGGWSSCSVSDGTCDIAVINDADKVFQKNYGSAMEANVCGENVGTPCTGTKADCCKLFSDPLGLTYALGKQILCGDDKKWHRCDDENACVSDGTSNYACNSGTWTKCAATETCTSGACVATATCGTNPQVTASPTSQSASAGDTKTYTITIKNNDQTGCSNRTFKLTASGPSGWPTISLDKASTISLSPGGSDTATLTVKSKNPESNGIYVISVIAEDSADSTKKSSVSVDYVIGALVCPANYKVEFTSSKIANEDNYILNIKVNDNETGEVCVYRYPISGVSLDMGISPSTFGIPLLPITGCSGLTGNLTCSNYDTGENTGSYGLGTYRVTINPDSTSCNYISPCFDTVEVVDCIDNSDCTAPATCVGDTCVAAGPGPGPGPGSVSSPLCQSALIASDVGKLCGVSYTVNAVDVGSWCCSAANGVALNQTICQAMDPACAAAAGAEICTGGADEDGDSDVDCADSDCAADPACVAAPSTCSGVSFYRSPLNYCTIQELLEASTGWILGLVSSIIILILIIGGIMYVASTGDQERIRTAKNIIYYAVLGLAIILLSYSMIAEIKIILKIP